MKILIVDDNEDAKIILAKTLEYNGHSIESAANGVEALAMAKKFSHDLIISDILMPEMDGFQLCREIKMDPDLQKIPFVFYTATYVETEDERLAISMGASRFIVKPIEGNAFLKIINEVIEEHQAGRLPLPEKPGEEETVLLRQHEARLTNKLKKKDKELKLREKRFTYLLHHDPLTDLPNRRLLMDRVGQAIKQAERDKSILAFLFVNLDRFKWINDSAGHDTGDRLLITVAKRLKACIRSSDTISRVVGDEFALLLGGPSDMEHVSTISQNILETMAQPLRFDGHDFSITASIGISLYPMDGCSGEALLNCAKRAVYRVKEQGRNAYQFYSEEMNLRSAELMVMRTEMRRALDREEFRVYYQPQVALKTGKISGMEALVRWEHPEKGFISPGAFIPLAEETNLILPLGKWVLETACRQTKVWIEEGFPELRVSVNLSTRQFQHEKLVDLVSSILVKTQLKPEQLELEITESIAMKDVSKSIETMSRLNKLGVQWAVDDFGTGYSSLSYLRKFSFDTLKVDRSFIHNLLTNPDAECLTSAIIAMAHTLRLKVIVEGVETKEQLAFSRSNPVDAIQGFYFSRALPPEDFTTLLREEKCLES